jgi:ribose transport system ATP-binding protein
MSAASGPVMAAPAAIRAAGVSKAYPGTQALNDAGLTIDRGTVHALVGGNGSGKSTLLKILGGVERADRGTIQVGERSFDASTISPASAHEAGLRFVHQQETVFRDHSVAENLAAGRRFARGRLGGISWRQMRVEATEILDRFDIHARPDELAANLGPATQRMLMIARALSDESEHPRLLVLDEATAALPTTDAAELIQTLRQLADGGQTILYVTHRLDELRGFADNVTVLRDGRVVAELDAQQADHGTLVELICGEAEVPDEMTRHGAGATTEMCLEVRDLKSGPIDGLSLSVASGEIVGVAGLVGAGRSSLLQTLFGAVRPAGGEILLDGKPFKPRSPADAIRRGVAFVPEDRSKEAGFHDMTVQDNLFAASISQFFRHLRLRYSAESGAADVLITRYGIKTPGPDIAFGALSGGNQQKVIIARWLFRRPRVLLLDEPTQGVDVHARAEIHQLVQAAANEGTAVIVASSDFDELVSLCSRLVVLVRGRITAGIDARDVTPEHLGQLSFGGLGDEHA